jgi:hypothetical protein
MSYKVAGIDVHKKVVMVVVIDRHNPDAKLERRRFLTMPSELQQLSAWLQDRGVEEVAMESTAQYWRSVWMELEPHMRLHLAQAIRRVVGVPAPSPVDGESGQDARNRLQKHIGRSCLRDERTLCTVLAPTPNPGRSRPH